MIASILDSFVSSADTPIPNPLNHQEPKDIFNIWFLVLDMCFFSIPNLAGMMIGIMILASRSQFSPGEDIIDVYWSKEI